MKTIKSCGCVVLKSVLDYFVFKFCAGALLRAPTYSDKLFVLGSLFGTSNVRFGVRTAFLLSCDFLDSDTSFSNSTFLCIFDQGYGLTWGDVTTMFNPVL